MLITETIAVVKLGLEKLQRSEPCREHAIAITHLDEALMWVERRESQVSAEAAAAKAANDEQ